MTSNDDLRPFERRVLAMRDAGHDIADIAAAFKRSAGHIERVLRWVHIPRSADAERRYPKAFEDRVLAWRAAGEPYDAIARRFRASPGFIRRVEGMAHYRRALRLLTSG
ncbi:MAG: hypothetical protein QY307_09900 [Acidimicrobiia bacterium]|nr:MAG: hypothetical protein QY307_09900 [Acidimicrobiia bacterium]